MYIIQFIQKKVSNVDIRTLVLYKPVSTSLQVQREESAEQVEGSTAKNVDKKLNRKRPILSLNTDIISDTFWKEHPELLKS